MADTTGQQYQGQVDFKESIGLRLIVSLDNWTKNLEKADNELSKFAKAVDLATLGLTTTFISQQKRLEGATNKIVGVFAGARNALVKWSAVLGTTAVAMAQYSTSYEREMYAMQKVAKTTGREFADVERLIAENTGGLARKSDLMTASVRLMNTSLSTKQMEQFINVIKDGSAVMGTDFTHNVEYVTKSILTLNPALLQNIGIMVRMEEVYDRALKKSPQASKELLTTAQLQEAQFELMVEQAHKYSGAHDELMKKGSYAWGEFKQNLADITEQLGRIFIPAVNVVARILTRITEVIKNVVSNEAFQTFFKALSLVALPALVALTVAFTALVPILKTVGSLLVALPIIALVTNFKGLTTELQKGVGPALSFLGERTKVLFRDVFKSFDQVFSALFNSIPNLFRTAKKELNAMQVTGAYKSTLDKMEYLTKNQNFVKEWRVVAGDFKEATKGMFNIPLVTKGFGQLRGFFSEITDSMRGGVISAMRGFGRALNDYVLQPSFKIFNVVKNLFVEAFAVKIPGALRATMSALKGLRVLLVEVLGPWFILFYGIPKVIGWLKELWDVITIGSKEVAAEYKRLREEADLLLKTDEELRKRKRRQEHGLSIEQMREAGRAAGQAVNDEFYKALTLGGEGKVTKYGKWLVGRVAQFADYLGSALPGKLGEYFGERYEIVKEQADAAKESLEGFYGAHVIAGAEKLREIIKNTGDTVSQLSGAVAMLSVNFADTIKNEKTFGAILEKTEEYYLQQISAVQTLVNVRDQLAESRKKGLITDADERAALAKVIDQERERIEIEKIKQYQLAHGGKSPQGRDRKVISDEAKQEALKVLDIMESGEKILTDLTSQQEQFNRFMESASGQAATVVAAQRDLQQYYAKLRQYQYAVYKEGLTPAERQKALDTLEDHIKQGTSVLSRYLDKMKQDMEDFKSYGKDVIDNIEAMQLTNIVPSAESAEEFQAAIEKVNMNKMRNEFELSVQSSNKFLQMLKDTQWQLDHGNKQMVQKEGWFKTQMEDSRKWAQNWVSEYSKAVQKWAALLKQSADTQRNYLNSLTESRNTQRDLIRELGAIERRMSELKHQRAEMGDQLATVRTEELRFAIEQKEKYGELFRIQEDRQELLSREVTALRERAQAAREAASDASLDLDTRKRKLLELKEIERQQREKENEWRKSTGRTPDTSLLRQGSIQMEIAGIEEEILRQREKVGEHERTQQNLKIQREEELQKQKKIQYELDMKRIAEEQSLAEFQKAQAENQIILFNAQMTRIAQSLSDPTERDRMKKWADDLSKIMTDNITEANTRAAGIKSAAGVSDKSSADLIKEMKESTAKTDVINDYLGQVDQGIKDLNEKMAGTEGADSLTRLSPQALAAQVGKEVSSVLEKQDIAFRGTGGLRTEYDQTGNIAERASALINALGPIDRKLTPEQQGMTAEALTKSMFDANTKLLSDLGYSSEITQSMKSAYETMSKINTETMNKNNADFAQWLSNGGDGMWNKFLTEALTGKLFKFDVKLNTAERKLSVGGNEIGWDQLHASREIVKTVYGNMGEMGYPFGENE